MKNFGLQLKKLRKARKLNQDQLALALGVRKTTVSNYETGYSMPPAHMLNQIADFFGVSLDELCGKTPPPFLGDNGITPLHNTASTKIHVYSAISAHSWLDNQLLFSFSIPSTFLGEGEFFGFKISGNRMDRAALTDGSIALIRRQKIADEGDIVILSFGAEPAIAGRYYRSGDMVTLVAESSNPVYHPIVINTKEQQVNIFGKVVKVIENVQ